MLGTIQISDEWVCLTGKKKIRIKVYTCSNIHLHFFFFTVCVWQRQIWCSGQDLFWNILHHLESLGGCGMLSDRNRDPHSCVQDTTPNSITSMTSKCYLWCCASTPVLIVFVDKKKQLFEPLTKIEGWTVSKWASCSSLSSSITFVDGLLLTAN